MKAMKMMINDTKETYIERYMDEIKKRYRDEDGKVHMTTNEAIKIMNDIFYEVAEMGEAPTIDNIPNPMRPIMNKIVENYEPGCAIDEFENNIKNKTMIAWMPKRYREYMNDIYEMAERYVKMMARFAAEY